MSDVSLALKNICISSSNDKLRLFVASSMSFKCSELSFESFNNTEILQLLLSRDVWVCRGNGCSFNFSILANGHPLPEECRNSLLGGLGAYLRDNTLWSQLSLESTLEVPNNQTRKKYDLSLKINYARRETSGNVLKPSIFPTLGDVKPPVGVPCFELQRIDITMNFKDFPSIFTARMNKHTQPAQQTEDSMLLDDDQALFQDKSDGFDELNMLGDFHDQWTYSKPEDGFESLLEETSRICDEELLLYNTDSNNTLLTQPRSTQFSLASQPAEIFPMALRPVKGANELDYNLTWRMADLALVSMIRGRQLKDQPDMKVWKNSQLTELSQIAPALLNPGYIEAMSQRAQFLSPIASAFSTSLLRNAQSPSLQRKLLSLQSAAALEQFTTQSSQSGITTIPQSFLRSGKEINQRIQTSLWKMMQLFLYDSSATRKLKTRLAGEVSAIKNAEDDESSMIDLCRDLEDSENVDHEQPAMREEVLGITADDLNEFFDNNEDGKDVDDFDILFEDWAPLEDEEQFSDLLENCSFVLDDVEFSESMEEDDKTSEIRPALGIIPISVLGGYNFRDDFTREVDSQEMLI